MDNSPVLLYDGLCGFCNGTVQFILKRDRTGTLRFAALEEQYARAVLARHPALHGVDSLVVVERNAAGAEYVLVRSDAVLWLARYLGGAWGLVRALWIIPRPVRDWGYDVFAHFRYRVFGRYDTCPLPSEAERARFILDG